MAIRRDGGPSARLSDNQLHELCSPMRMLVHLPSAFRSDEDRRDAWFRHKPDVMAFYREHYGGAHTADCEGKPEAWWAYEAPEGKRRPYREPTPRRGEPWSR